MKIYFAHSSGFYFKKEYYHPIHAAGWSKEHEVVMPHEHSSEQYDSKAEMRSFDLIVAEVSYASTGLGIELGWADSIGVPVVAVYKEGSKPTGAIYAVTDNVFDYESAEDLQEKLGVFIAGMTD